MNILIAEDEVAARRNLLAILQEVEPDCHILASCSSVAETREWIEKNPAPDIAFFDIQLSDTSIFKLFQTTRIDFPVVFVTAYSQYAIDAFKVNSIDYILKPVSAEQISFAINKFKNTRPFNFERQLSFIEEMLRESRQRKPAAYLRSLLVHKKDKLIPLLIKNVAYFYIDSGMIYAVSDEGNRHTINKKLDELENQLDPEHFYRANRQFIIARSAVREINQYFNERLSVKLSPDPGQRVIISKSKSSHFKNWLVI